jgi:hypothetical protein
MGRILRILGGLVFACIICSVAVGGLALFLTQGVANEAEKFMKAIQEERLEDAYALLSPTYQENMTQSSFEDYFSGMEVESWTFTSRNIENDTALVSGTAVIDGDRYMVRFLFLNIDGTWLINDYQFAKE